MKVLLIRHAHALSRKQWDQPDAGRPLDERGQRQAAALGADLADHPIVEVLSSPAVRCVDTVAPLATARGLAVEPHAALVEGAAPVAGVDLVRGLADRDGDTGDVALCSHGDVIPSVIRALADSGVDLEEQPTKKGAYWVLEVEDRKLVRGRYVPPPT